MLNGNGVIVIMFDVTVAKLVELALKLAVPAPTPTRLIVHELFLADRVQLCGVTLITELLLLVIATMIDSPLGEFVTLNVAVVDSPTWIVDSDNAEICSIVGELELEPPLEHAVMIILKRVLINNISQLDDLMYWVKRIDFIPLIIIYENKNQF